jgi:hypothetical protein
VAGGSAISGLLLVAAAFLSSLVSLLVLGSLLVLAEAPVLVRKAVLLIFILFLALGQPHFVTELARRFRMSKSPSLVVSSGTIISSLVLLAFGLLVSRAL